MRYGRHPVFLTAAQISDADHDTIAAQSDVIAIPPLDSTVTGGARNAVRNRLELLNIPGDWVTVGTPYRQIVRVVAKVFLFTQRHLGIARPRQLLFEAGITLSTTWSELTSGQKSRLIAAADSLNLDTSGVGPNTTIKQMLKGMADQLPALSLYGESL